MKYVKTRKAVRGLRELDTQKDKSPPYHKVFPWRGWHGWREGLKQPRVPCGLPVGEWWKQEEF